MSLMQAGWPGAIVALVVGMMATGAATWAGASGIGADRAWQQGVSLRNESIRSGRVFVGGGLIGGK